MTLESKEMREKFITTTFYLGIGLNPTSASQGVTRQLTFEQLHQQVQKEAFSPVIYENNRRKADNFLYSDLVALDIDKDLSIDEAIIRLNTYELAYSITKTKSHQKIKNEGSSSEQAACDRFRILLPLRRRIESKEGYMQALKNIRSIFPELDRQCLDLARFFFPSTGGN